MIPEDMSYGSVIDFCSSKDNEVTVKRRKWYVSEAELLSPSRTEKEAQNEPRRWMMASITLLILMATS